MRVKRYPGKPKGFLKLIPISQWSQLPEWEAATKPPCLLSPCASIRQGLGLFPDGFYSLSWFISLLSVLCWFQVEFTASGKSSKQETPKSCYVILLVSLSLHVMKKNQFLCVLSVPHMISTLSWDSSPRHLFNLFSLPTHGSHSLSWPSTLFHSQGV